MPALLLVDDEPSILLLLLKAIYPDATVQIEVARTAAEGLEKARTLAPDVILLDVVLPDQTGLELFPQLQELDPRRPVIFITSDETTGTVIEAMKLGAHDYLVKPVALPALKQTLTLAFEVSRLARVPAVIAESSEAPADPDADAIIGRCPVMREVYKTVGRVAAQDVTVLILGESGTGKELIARAIYQNSKRANGPFLAINCAAIPEPLLESELFGHEKGSFTGADRRRIGKFEQCHGGTLFLDEIGDMPLMLQAKLLRLLQDGSFERVGSNEHLKADVRLIAATNHNLEALMNQGRFRPDLYYRLNVVTLRLSPLRERGDDLLLLIRYFLARFNRAFNKHVERFTPEALMRLQQHLWPGNVRELQSVLKQVVLRTSGSVVLPEFLPAELLASTPTALELPETSAPTLSLERFIDERITAGTLNLYEETQQQMEMVLLTRVLQETSGNQLRAARLLGISRGRLRSKLRELGIQIRAVVDGPEDDDG